MSKADDGQPAYLFEFKTTGTHMNENQFLNGCGIEYVHWIPVAEKPPGQSQQHRIQQSSFATPILAVMHAHKNVSDPPGNGPGPRRSGCLIRVRKRLLNHDIKTWEDLLRVTSKQFRDWKNYGEASHRELVAIANENGYQISPW